MKRILSAVLCLCLTAAANAQPQNISTGATPWKVLPGNTPALIITSPHFVWQSNVNTPVSGTNAQWINSTGTLSAPSIIYTFEKDITVPAGTGGLNLNFQVSADDILQAIQLVKPGGSTTISLGVPPIPSTSQPYQLRRAIDTTIKCPEPGTWKLRTVVRFLDATGGFLLSGYANLTQGSCCNCGKWGTTSVSSTGFSKQVKCGQTVVIKRGVPVTIKPVYNCTGGCEAKYTATLTYPSGSVQNFSGNSFSFTATQLCNYRLTITPICGDKKCEPCIISFFSTIGCPGDVTGGSKFDDYNVISLGEMQAHTIKDNVLGVLQVSAEGDMLDIANGNYKLVNDKGTVNLLDARGKVAKTWTRIPVNITPNADCEQQEREQWDWFWQNQFPGLQAMATQRCKAFLHMVYINCNGSDYAFYPLLIKPVMQNCPVYTNSQYQNAMKITSLEKE